MCVDYTNLNKACPKNASLLPNIDRLVNGAYVFKLLSFLDAYSGYNQIKMYPLDQEKTNLIANGANFCYKVMPFGLKNASATYQRLMDKVSKELIKKNFEVYVDDMVGKSLSPDQHARDLTKIFAQLIKHNMRLNPEKCTFGVGEGKFLGFMLT